MVSTPRLHLLQHYILRYHLVKFRMVISKLLDRVVIPRLLQVQFLVKLPSRKLLSYLLSYLVNLRLFQSLLMVNLLEKGLGKERKRAM